jgi:hypothetical protein
MSAGTLDHSSGDGVAGGKIIVIFHPFAERLKVSANAPTVIELRASQLMTRRRVSQAADHRRYATLQQGEQLFFHKGCVGHPEAESVSVPVADNFSMNSSGSRPMARLSRSRASTDCCGHKFREFFHCPGRITVADTAVS